MDDEYTKFSGLLVLHSSCVIVRVLLQEELPEGYQLIHEWTADFSSIHKLIELSSCLQVHQPKQYKAAAEFCKISGLLCSYGLYQVCLSLFVLLEKVCL